MQMNDAEDAPRFVRSREPLKIVVEGVGDVVKNYYKPAFEVLLRDYERTRELQIHFTDMSEFWRGDTGLTAKMEDISASLTTMGFAYLDKSDSTQLAQYQALEPDVVIIATPDFTHVEVAEEWLRRDVRPEQIFIEKPLSNSLKAARRLLGETGPGNNSVLAFDHYRARLLPSRDQMGILLGFLGKGIRRFIFYFLEDRSGSDPRYASVGRDGAIENEQRVRTLNQGVILDGMPHVIAILAHFAKVETLIVTRVRAGQYVGVDGDPDKRTEIEKETFAEVGFICADYAANLILGTVYIGKAVRGVRSLGEDFDSNTKVLDIEGLNGNKARFDLRSSGNGASRAYLIDERDSIQVEFPLSRQPYATFLEKIADGTYLRKPHLAFNVELAKRILEVLDDMRYPMNEGNNIPTYPGGMSGKRQSLYLEDILNHLPISYGK
jgi:predicted dehydrogenase